MGKANEKKRLYIAAAVAAAAVAVIVLAVVLFLGGREASYRSIRIVELEGSVTIDRESVGSLEASVNMNLVSGDHVTTSAGAYVVLRLDEDKYVMLGEQGAMKVEAEGDASKGRTAIRLEAGSVLSEIQNPLGQNSSYEIVTPSATMSVRGTVFEVRQNGTDSDGNVEVLVYEGKVAVGIEGQEPVLYGGGEYTQFTAGDTPRFLVERSTIRSEQMNSQMLKRLQQIEESGRSLDFGQANLEDLIGRMTSDSASLAADNSQVQKSEGTDDLPAPDTQNPITASPSPDVTASETPASTERPRSSAAPAPAVTPEPSVAPTPAATPKPSADPTQSPASSTKPVPSERPDSGEKWTVVFYVPAIVKSDTGDVVHFYGNADPVVFSEQKLTAGSKITKPKEPTFSDVPGGASDDFVFVEWVTEQNEKWDFVNHSVNRNITLYPVWRDKDGELYYTVTLSDLQTSYYRCGNVKAGSYLLEGPETDEDNKGYEGSDCPKREGYRLIAWEITNRGSENNHVRWNRTDTVQGVTSLTAVWE